MTTSPGTVTCTEYGLILAHSNCVFSCELTKSSNPGVLNCSEMLPCILRSVDVKGESKAFMSHCTNVLEERLSDAGLLNLA
jgi:hypothetical protein